MNLKRHLGTAILAGATVLFAARAAAADTHGVLDAWLKAQDSFKTWSADFTQTRTLKTLTQPLVSSGHVWFALPNRFRWELGHPPQTIAVRGGNEMQVIYPRLKRVERYPLAGPEAGLVGQALALLDAGFPRDRKSFESHFHVKSIIETNAAWQIDLQPANAATRHLMPLIRVTLATNDFSLLANEIVLPDGSRMRNDFTHAVSNRPLDDSLFRPKLEADYTITEPLKR